MKKLKEHKFPMGSFIGGWYIPNLLLVVGIFLKKLQNL